MRSSPAKPRVADCSEADWLARENPRPPLRLGNFESRVELRISTHAHVRKQSPLPLSYRHSGEVEQCWMIFAREKNEQKSSRVEPYIRIKSCYTRQRTVSFIVGLELIIDSKFNIEKPSVTIQQHKDILRGPYLPTWVACAPPRHRQAVLKAGKVCKSWESFGASLRSHGISSAMTRRFGRC